MLNFRATLKLFFLYFRCMTPGRLWNYLLLRFSHTLSRIFSKVLIFGQAYAVSTEVVAGCNLRCPGCEQGIGILSRKKGVMSMDDFFLALNKLPSTVFHINLHFQGEPLMHPEIAQFIRLARKKKLFVSFSTNANLLSGSIAGELIRAGLSHLIISLDGHNQQTYETYRKGGDFNLLLHNMKQLAEKKKKSRRKLPVIEVQTVVTAANEDYLGEIRKIAFLNGADIFRVKTAYVPDLTNVPDYLPRQEKFRRYLQNPDGTLRMKKSGSGICFRANSSCVILFNLDVVSCCFDKNGTFILGNLKEEPFENIHRGNRAKLLSQNMAKGNAPAMCRNCTE
jgi:MoaA/NifB/PqqE/SkfB family radical SAM enzyme